MMMTAPLLAFELKKLWRSRRPWMALAAIAFFLVLMLLGFWLYADKQTGGEAEFRYTFENESYFNGLTFTVYGFWFGFALLLPVFVTLEAAASLAGERDSGGLRLLLVRPVTRTRLFAVKWGVTMLFALALAGALLGACLLVGLVCVGFGDLTLYPGVLQMTDVYQRLPQGEALRRFLLVWPCAALLLMAPSALAMCVAAFTRSAVHAAGVALAIYLVLHVVAAVPFFQDLRPFLFTSQIGAWRELLHEDIDWARLGGEVLRALSVTCLLLGVALWRFRTGEER